MKNFLLAALASIYCLDVSGALAEEFTPLKNERREVRLQDFQPHLHSQEGYSEQWSFGVWNDEGKFLIGVDAVVSNIGLGDHNGGFKVKFVDSAGKEITCGEEYDNDEWSWSSDRFQLDFGRNRIRGDSRGFSITTRCEKLSLDLEFKNLAQPVFPGNGQVKFGDSGLYSMFFPCPRARVSGTVIREGKQEQIQGWGFAEHSFSNMAPYKQSKRWFRFKLVNRDITMVLAEFESTEDYGKSRTGWAVVADDSGTLLATARVRFEFDKFIEDKNSPEGYSLPRLVRLAAVDGENQMVGTMIMTGLKGIDDPTANLGAIKKAVVRRFTKPRDYYINCDYDFTIRKAGTEPRQIKNSGFYRFMHVNP